MKQLKYTTKSSSTKISDSVIILPTDDLKEVLQEGILRNIGLDMDVTISGVTMFLSAWLDPEHWASDWAEKLNLGGDDNVFAAVESLLANGISVT